MIKMMKCCPKYGSSNGEWMLPHVWSKWECKDCGYIGVFIIEDGKIAETLRDEYHKKPKGRIE